jgi:hypothetical protein
MSGGQGGGGGQHQGGGGGGGQYRQGGSGGGQQMGGGGGGRNRRNRSRRGGSQPAFVGPMDHSYRQNQGEGNGNSSSRPQGRYGNQPNRPQQFFNAPAVDPLPLREDATTRIYAFIDDLFFLTKMQDTARKLNVKLEFVKTVEDLLEKVEQRGGEAPSLIVFDLNNVNAKPLQSIPKLRAKFKRGTSIVGFVSHVQGDLKLKAQEAGCDSVMPRSAFSQNLPQILRRHGAPDDIDEPQSQFGLGSGTQ